MQISHLKEFIDGKNSAKLHRVNLSFVTLEEKNTNVLVVDFELFTALYGGSANFEIDLREYLAEALSSEAIMRSSRISHVVGESLRLEGFIVDISSTFTKVSNPDFFEEITFRKLLMQEVSFSERQWVEGQVGVDRWVRCDIGEPIPEQIEVNIQINTAAMRLSPKIIGLQGAPRRLSGENRIKASAAAISGRAIILPIQKEQYRLG